MREIITTTGASLFTAGVIIAQAIAAPAASVTQHTLAMGHATIRTLAR